jgi:hypothetical protein
MEIASLYVCLLGWEVNVKLDGLLEKIFLGTLAVVFGAYLLPIGIEALAGTNTTNWTKLTGGSGIIAVFGLMGLIFVAGFAIALLKGWISF